MNWRNAVDPTYWHKQAANKPLFDDLFWSKPENKRSAGKLLIIGGNLHAVMAPAVAYQAAGRAGIGTARVLLPDAIAKTIGKSFAEGEFAFSTPSGSFAKTAIGQVTEHSDWTDAVLLAGDFGRNSETAIFLEQIVDKFKGPLVITGDGLDYFASNLAALTDHGCALMVVPLPQLQKLMRAGMPTLVIQQSMSLHALAGLLSNWTRESKARILTYHSGHYVYGDGGQVSTTPAEPKDGWPTQLAAYAAVWWLQHIGRSFEAITSAIFDFNKD
jgi:Carbohydrate kinase